MNIAKKWNWLDSVLFLIEQKCSDISQAVRDSREPEPDVETMIEAETRYLQDENKKLKKKDYPHKVDIKELNDHKIVTCPCCGIDLTHYLDINTLETENSYPKFCFECGNIIYFPFKIQKSTERTYEYRSTLKGMEIGK